MACAKVREKICEKERKRERKIDELYKYYMDIIYTYICISIKTGQELFEAEVLKKCWKKFVKY